MNNTETFTAYYHHLLKAQRNIIEKRIASAIDDAYLAHCRMMEARRDLAAFDAVHPII